jgi:D-glycero-D-manno-heptose 1,7-bisphosphate phosphatase
MAKKFKINSEIVVLCGIPGIGKSYVAQNLFPYHHRINLDSIHEMISCGEGFEKKNLGLARNIEDLIIKDQLVRGCPILIDNTNVTEEKRSRYIDYARRFGVPVKAVYFEPDTKKAVEQNRKRERKVPKIAIYKMIKDFSRPDIGEGFCEVIDSRNLGRMFGDKPAVFFDRDGVLLNNKIDNKDYYVNKAGDIIFYDNTFKALKKLDYFEKVIISNQAGVANKMMSKEDLENINEELKIAFLRNNIKISDIYCCTHHQESNCRCRKPKTGMVIQAAYEQGIDLNSSYIIGDMSSDLELGKRAGLKKILVNTGCAGSDLKYDTKPDFLAKDIEDAVVWILADKK